MMGASAGVDLRWFMFRLIIVRISFLVHIMRINMGLRLTIKFNNNLFTLFRIISHFDFFDKLDFI